MFFYIYSKRGESMTIKNTFTDIKKILSESWAEAKSDTRKIKNLYNSFKKDIENIANHEIASTNQDSSRGISNSIKKLFTGIFKDLEHFFTAFGKLFTSFFGDLSYEKFPTIQRESISPPTTPTVETASTTPTMPPVTPSSTPPLLTTSEVGVTR